MIDNDVIKRLEDLHRLKTEGVITEVEFEKAKTDLLNGRAARTSAPSFQPPIAPRELIGLPARDDHIGWATLPLRRYADFTGRSTRKEFWMFMLVFVALFLGCAVFSPIIGPEGTAGLLLLGLLGLVVPLVACEVRRFHDQDKSGWYALINLIPYLGAFIVHAMMLIDGTQGENRFGPDPRG